MRDLRKGIEAAWDEGYQVLMYTVTSHTDMTLQDWRDAWHRWVTSMKVWLHRQGIREIIYEWTKEYGEKNGMRHVHGFLGFKQVPGKRINLTKVKDKTSDLWRCATKGKAFITKVKQLLKRNGMKAAYYALKYVAKQECQEQFEKKERRFGFSRNWPRVRKEKTGLWEAVVGVKYPSRALVEKYGGMVKEWAARRRQEAKLAERLETGRSGIRERHEKYGSRWKDRYCFRLTDFE